MNNRSVERYKLERALQYHKIAMKIFKVLAAISILGVVGLIGWGVVYLSIAAFAVNFVNGLVFIAMSIAVLSGITGLILWTKSDETIRQSKIWGVSDE